MKAAAHAQMISVFPGWAGLQLRACAHVRERERERERADRRKAEEKRKGGKKTPQNETATRATEIPIIRYLKRNILDS